MNQLRPDPTARARAARLQRPPRGDLAAERRILDAVSEVYERYGFEALDTGAFEYADALGKFLPDADRPNEGVFALQDDDEQWMALRYDLTAPLARFAAQNWETPAQALPPLRLRAGVAQREARPRPLPRVRPVRRRHGGLRPPRGRRRDHRHGGGGLRGRRPAARAAVVLKINNRKLLNGLLTAAGVAERGPEAGACCARWTSSTGWARDGVRLLLGEGRKDESGDFTKGAGLNAAAVERGARLHRRRRAAGARRPSTPRRRDRRLGGGRRGPGRTRRHRRGAERPGRRRRPRRPSIPRWCAGWNTTPARCSRRSCCLRPRTSGPADALRLDRRRRAL